MGEGEGNEHLVHEVAEAADRDSKEPPVASRGALIRSYAVLIAALTGCATAVGAFFKPTDHTVTQQSYEELAKRFDAISDQQQKTHDDLVALRAYMAAKNNEVFALPSQPPAADAGAPVLLHPLVRPAASVSSPLVPASTLPPPELHPFVKSTTPPPFSAVLKASKM